jgi:hypothetical protein
MKFGNWDRRPSVTVGDTSWALLTPGGDWVEVDHLDVGETAARVSDEAAFRAMFEPTFGKFDLPAAALNDASEASSAAE